MKKLSKSLLCVFFPWLILLINDNPGGALVALVMQASVIGWPFAIGWAWRTHNSPPVATSNQKPKS